MEMNELGKWTYGQLDEDIAKGGKFVYFTFTISIFIMTFKRPSKVYYIPSSGSAIAEGWPFLLCSLLLGWWGIPWGPIYTIGSIYTAFVGEDVTKEVRDSMNAQA